MKERAWVGGGEPVVSESSRTQCAVGAWLRGVARRQRGWGGGGLLTHFGAGGGVRRGGCWRLDSHANLGNQGDGPGPASAWWTEVISGKRWNEAIGRQVFISFLRRLAVLLCASQRAGHLSEERHLDKRVIDRENCTLCSAFLQHKRTKRNERVGSTMCILFPKHCWTKRTELAHKHLMQSCCSLLHSHKCSYIWWWKTDEWTSCGWETQNMCQPRFSISVILYDATSDMDQSNNPRLFWLCTQHTSLVFDTFYVFQIVSVLLVL